MMLMEGLLSSKVGRKKVEESYKIIPLTNGFIALFETPIQQETENSLYLGIYEKDKDLFLTIGDHHLIKIEKEIIPLIETAERIFIGVCKKNDKIAKIICSIEIDKITIGKLIAYYEIKNE